MGTLRGHEHGGTGLLILIVMFVLVVLPIWGIIDAADRPDSVWEAAKQSKVLWIVLQIFLGGLGAVIYFAAIRPKLTRHRRLA